MYKARILIFIFIAFGCAQAQTLVVPSEKIRLNQIGFYPEQVKMAVIVGDRYSEFQVLSADSRTKVFEGSLGKIRRSKFADTTTRLADFTAFRVPGSYVLVVPGLGESFKFEIADAVYRDVLKASIKGYYFQRFSTALPEKYAGRWSRPFSHADNRVLIHGSAADANRPEGTLISSPSGWIDAGDYNKYIVNSGITMGTLLSLLEEHPDFFTTLSLNIPESNNDLPDLLDEILWNLRWMLTMQDPSDGGVYHKCTNAKFDPMVMPHQATTPRYVVQKGTAAALDFAAVTAQAARVLKKFSMALPGLSDSCLTASRRAWDWAIKHPDVIYDQQQINAQFDPDIVTGAYGDKNFQDEFAWAASELSITTGQNFIKTVTFFPDQKLSIPSWNQVRLLGYYSLLRSEKTSPLFIRDLLPQIKTSIIQLSDSMVSGVDGHAYHTVMGSSVKDFVWGSNAVAANQSILLIQAFRISKDKKYLAYALHNLDYLLGRNATGFSFITGYGDKTPMHPHHRPSEADGVTDPVPGLLVGGPNPSMQDKCSYPSSVPDEAFVDDVCSYASNEIAINWNAPLVYLLGSVEALRVMNVAPAVRKN
jgi:endoglucanase